MSLFKSGDFTLHSGAHTDWMIDCDTLTDDDLASLAIIASKLVPPFEYVVGVPTGGLRFAAHMGRHTGLKIGNVNRVLIVDDVCTTGASFEKTRADLFPTWQVGGENYQNGWVNGLAIFARGPIPSWARAIWKLYERYEI